MTRRSLRKCALAALVAVLAVVSAAAAADVLADLGVTRERAVKEVFDAFTGASVYFPGKTEVFKAATPAQRALMVTAVCTLGKAYVQSDAFKQRYAEFRDANRPAPPESADDLLATQRKAFEESVRQMQEQMKNLPPEAQKEAQATIAEMKEMMEALASDPEHKAAMEQGLKAEEAGRLEAYKKELKEFETRYPENPEVLVAARLKEFLALTAGIDFDAKLVEQSSKLRFVDQALERKSSEWKFCFRAGREATEAARAFATQWLTELSAK